MMVLKIYEWFYWHVTLWTEMMFSRLPHHLASAMDRSQLESECASSGLCSLSLVHWPPKTTLV